MANSIRQRLADAALSRLVRQGPAANDYVVATARIPMRDGVVLVADHFAPVTARPRGTVLMRTPYGRGFPASALNGRLFAARGYHVILQSVRGTFGSGGRFVPMAQEAEDGHDTVAWLREQPWFDGRLATLGASYLGWTQWALLQDPPPELRTAVVYVGPHDFREAVFGTGAFTLGDFLGWSDMIARQEDGGLLRRLLNSVSAGRRLRPALEGVPLPDAADPVLRGRAPWYRDWLSHPDGDDPWWRPYRAGDALTTVTTPTLIISGWQDLFLDQSLQQYAALQARNVDVGLTVGPWTHLQLGVQGAATLARESLSWLDEHLADGPASRKSPVRVFRTGERRWHELAAWPPPSAPAVFQLHADQTLTLSANPTDPPLETDPTPAGSTPSSSRPDPTPAAQPGVRSGSARPNSSESLTHEPAPAPPTNALIRPATEQPPRDATTDQPVSGGAPVGTPPHTGTARSDISHEARGVAALTDGVNASVAPGAPDQPSTPTEPGHSTPPHSANATTTAARTDVATPPGDTSAPAAPDAPTQPNTTTPPSNTSPPTTPHTPPNRTPPPHPATPAHQPRPTPPPNRKPPPHPTARMGQ
ncbi:CocE/NonD family hydrolase [Paractinoplanes brasiliensis]|uniref:Xaa-Pro dipeptidyl-peptidase-like domain-containing protein n=1 Tax=Paractinoplanes brasiliensis TaxID=52695 RepID=A0A4R6JUS2_9ACTN|nr:CocE/NonD family hydrolase [Actinoplanes brasiliensis]TDO40464.1 hypothetical protein C8E87_4178 [Actinoplanes brasiliensis]